VWIQQQGVQEGPAEEEVGVPPLQMLGHGVYETTSNTDGFNMGSSDNEIHKPEVGDVSTEEPDTDIISVMGEEGSFDKSVDMKESISQMIASKEPSNHEFTSYDSATRDSSLPTPSRKEESIEEHPVHKPEVEADGDNTAVEASLGDHEAATPAEDTSEDVPPAEHLPWLNMIPGSLLQAPAGRINVPIILLSPTSLKNPFCHKVHHAEDIQQGHQDDGDQALVAEDTPPGHQTDAHQALVAENLQPGNRSPPLRKVTSGAGNAHEPLEEIPANNHDAPVLLWRWRG
jgi:hypothetical protein